MEKHHIIGLVLFGMYLYLAFFFLWAMGQLPYSTLPLPTVMMLHLVGMVASFWLMITFVRDLFKRRLNGSMLLFWLILLVVFSPIGFGGYYLTFYSKK